MFKFLFISLFTATSLFAQIPTYVPSNGLVGWWPFDGNANDESVSGNNGTVNGSVLTSDRFGTVNSAYSFDGIDDRINILISNIAQGNSPRTISFWALYLGDISNNNQQIVGYGGTITNERFSILYRPSELKVDICAHNNDFGAVVNNVLNFWHFYTAVYNGSNVTLYLDGQIIAQSIKNYNTIGNEVFVGYNGNFNHEFGEPYHGKIDDIGIWNRALSASEISSLYAGCNLSITSQPQDQNVNISAGSASFSTTSSSTNASFQWQINLGLGFQNLSNAGQFNGVNSPMLTISNVNMSNNNQVFRCIIQDGVCADTTTEAILLVIDNVGVNLDEMDNLLLYPNPVTNELNVIGLANDTNKFEIFNVSGSVVLNGDFLDRIRLDNLNTGTYHIKINNQNTFLFVKQ